MYCKKCGTQMGESLLCPSCGFQNSMEDGLLTDESSDNEATEPETVLGVVESEKSEIVRNKIWAWCSGIMFVIALFPLYKGYDKMTNYYSSDTYYSLNKNAYVGGDAYNYIINGEYATAFFVLAIGAALMGIGFLIVYYISGKKVE
ncbi:MAG: hypothetical protein LIP16_00115 [Clostridium sp.]|nr:hypothetical protein [Clostridium sp.]